MRKQILAGLIAAVALLFSVVALTSAPASGTDYSSYASDKGATATTPAINGAVITGVVNGPAGIPVVLVTSAGTVTTVTNADGSYTLTIPVGAVGPWTITAGGDLVVAQGTIPAPTTTTTTGTTGTTGTVVVTTTTGTTGTTGVVTPAVNYGFGNGIPTQPALAVTGSESSVLGFIATGLIALGAVAMGSRRKFLQGALEV